MLVISTQSFTMWLLRATWARGVWKENDYNTRGELTSVDYSDTTPSDSFTYSTDGNLIATSNSKAASVFENTALGIATNETQTVAPYTTTLERGLDAYSRQTSLSVSGEPTQSISYNVENQFSGTQNSDATAVCAYTLDGKYAGRTVCATNGITLFIPVVRDSWRRDLITGTETRDSQSNLLWKSALQYDPLNWLVSRTDNDTDLNTFSYNSCSEVVSASIGGVPYLYAYDDIGNQISNVLGNVSNTFTANAVNQYSAINNTSLTYDLDGNLLSCRCLTYTWDAANRCTSVSSNEVLLLTNEYGTQSRRVRKITPTATHTYFYDGWNLVLEIIDYPDQTQDRISYVWGVDISGTPQGSGGVGGLYWVKYNNVVYIPTYDSNGNIIAYYHGNTGNAVATYQYDAFGCTVAQSGSMASFFRHRFSTKYYDEETGLYYYGYRFYLPQMGRWLNRDPIEEDGGRNLYVFCNNDSINEFDILGEMPVWMERRAKYLGYKAFRSAFVREPHWQSVMDAWFFETGPNPITFSGLLDPRNRDISTNPGFVKLMNCYVAQKHGVVPPTGRWTIDSSGFQWTYTYSRNEAAGGFAAFRSDTEFLGSYRAYITDIGATGSGKCKFKIHVYNVSGWTSGTRLPGFVANALRHLGWSGTSIFYDHGRHRARYYPSSGGNFTQNYKFELEWDCCPKCRLP